MADKLKLEVLLQAIDKATAPFKSVQSQSKKLAENVKKAKLELKDLQAKLDAAGKSSGKYGAASEALKVKVAGATAALRQEEAALTKLNARLKQINQAQADYRRGMNARGRMQGAGMSMLAGGAVAGAAAARPVIDYAQAEDSATQLKAAMMRAGGVVGPEFDKIDALAERLGNKLPGTTAELTDMMTMLQRQGLSAANILGGTGEATAFLGVQLKMAYTEAAEFAAKMQDATRTTEKDMMGLMDTIQKSFYLGVDSGNMLQGFAKISPALSIIKKEGLEAAKMIAPLLVMADQSGMAGEAAGNAYRKIFQSAMNADSKLTKANLGVGLKVDFTNGKGEFGGLDKMFSQFTKLKKLNTQDRVWWMKTAFGDDAETLQALNLIIDKGKAGYQEIQAKMQAQASLQERVNSQLGTLKNLWEAATGTFTNALVAVGESVGPEVKSIVTWLGDVAAKAQAWAKANPGLSSAILKTVAAVGALLAVLGGISLVLATIMGPMLIIRLGFAMLGPTLASLSGILGGVFSGALGIAKFAILGVGRALLTMASMAMAHPLIALIALVAAGAILIYRNWDTLGPKFAALWSRIHSAMVAKWTAIMAWFTGLKERFMLIGGQIIDGLIQGINAKWEAAKARLSAIAASIANTVKGTLGIQSPSRVFMQIGGYTMEGLALGLNRSQSAPLSAAKGITRRLAGMGAGLALASSPALAYTPDTRAPISASSTAIGGGSLSVTVNVYAAAGQSEQSIAKQVAAEFERIQRQQAARGRARLSDRD